MGVPTDEGMNEVTALQDGAAVVETIYGRKMISLVAIRTATQKAAISAGTIMKSFMKGR